MKVKNPTRATASLLWRLHPNGGRVAVVAVPSQDREGLMRQGWLKVNGCRATITEWFEDAENLSGMDALRIVFDKPYPEPHP